MQSPVERGREVVRLGKHHLGLERVEELLGLVKLLGFVRLHLDLLGLVQLGELLGLGRLHLRLLGLVRLGLVRQEQVAERGEEAKGRNLQLQRWNVQVAVPL